MKSNRLTGRLEKEQVPLTQQLALGLVRSTGPWEVNPSGYAPTARSHFGHLSLC